MSTETSTDLLVPPEAIAHDLCRHPTFNRLLGVRFLARGEYTLNYLANIQSRDIVVRLITGSQMGLSLTDQLYYEAQALRLLTPSNRTPQLIGVEPHPERLTYPFLVMTYLPGTPLDYATDLVPAAHCLARIHRVVIPTNHQTL